MSSPTEPERDGGEIVVGVLADPEAAPTEVATHLGDRLAVSLGEQVTGDVSWQVDVRRERLPAGDRDIAAMIDVAANHAEERGWHLTLCVTDLPLRSGRHPVVAELSRQRRVAVVSLPALGGMRLRHRVRGIAVQMVAELYRLDAEHADVEEERPGSWSRGLVQIDPDDDSVDVRLRVSRGRLRLLIGMVRANRPWGLVLGLTSALAAAIAFSVFWLVNTAMWELAASLHAARLATFAVLAVVAMVAWLIIAHQLWERADDGLASDREEIALFNASTLLTLLIGVGFMYLAIFLFNLTAGLLLFDGEVLEGHIEQPPDVWTWLAITWLATSAATIAGALGSSFENERTVHEAAYSYRERERRQRGDVGVPDTTSEG